MFTSNIGTITTVLNLNIYLHCQIVFYINEAEAVKSRNFSPAINQ